MTTTSITTNCYGPADDQDCEEVYEDGTAVVNTGDETGQGPGQNKPAPARPIKPIGYPGAYLDLADPECYKFFGFSSAKAAQDAFKAVDFEYSDLGQLQVQSGPDGSLTIVDGTPPPAQNTAGTNTVEVNFPDYNWINFSNVLATNITTGQPVFIDYLAAENQFLGTNMTTVQLTQLILLHEFRHTPLGGNAPQEPKGDATLNTDILKHCIK